MFGYLRFLLSIMVMLSHIGIRVYGLNQGVIAVVIFYILAGFVVSYLFINIFPNISLFYKDRIKRIFPLYLYNIIITIIFLLLTNYGNPHFSLSNILTNLLIIPLNYYMLIDNTILTDPSWWLIPPAWSLGTELQAYILLPFILLYPKIKYISIFISFIIYLLSAFVLIQPDYFGYRLIVGVLFIFILGVSIRDKRAIDKAFLLLVWVVTLILLYFHIDNKAYIKETSISMVIGIPLIYALSITKIKLPLNSFFGSLSYAIFLSHFLAIWIVDYLAIMDYKLIYIVSISLLISLFGVFIEKKLKKRM